LVTLHDLTTHESPYQKVERSRLLAELWTILGGNRVKKQIFEDNLELLKDLDKLRRTAVSQIQTTLYSLTSFQLDLQELRGQVARPNIIEIPIEIHIENVGKGIERLRSSKVALKSGNGIRKSSKLIDQSEDNNVEVIKND